MLKALLTVVAVIGGYVIVQAELNFPHHATLAHRAIPVVAYVVVVAALAAWVKSRDSARSSSRGSGGSASGYQYRNWR